MGWIVTTERIAHDAAQYIAVHVHSPILGLLVINVLLLVVGTFLETVPALLILSPILLPVVKGLGIDPVHFGVIISYNLILGIIHPPLGIGLFVAARVARITPEQVLSATWPFFIPLFAGLLIVLMWALTVLALMERQVRKNLQGEPMYGLYPENRPSPAPTGARLIEKFATLSIVIIHDDSGTHRRFGQLSRIHREILKLLDLPDTALKTFKRRCGT